MLDITLPPPWSEYSSAPLALLPFSPLASPNIFPLSTANCSFDGATSLFRASAKGDRLVSSPPAYTADLSALPATLDGAKRLTEVLQVRLERHCLELAIARSAEQR